MSAMDKEQRPQRLAWQEGRPLRKVTVTIVSTVIYAILRGWSATWAIDRTAAVKLDAALASRKPVIGVMWHGNYVPLFYLMSGRPALVITSYSFRGAVIAGFCRRFGYRAMQVERGNHGGRLALREELSREGGLVAIAVDGPLGPRHVAKPGAAALAAETGAQIVPISATSSRKAIVSKRWDLLEIPLPTARVTLKVGDPVVIPAGTSAADATALVEERLNAL